MNQSEISNIHNRFNSLMAYDSLDNICRKMNAEFEATFYRSQGSVWASYKDDSGKAVLRTLHKEI